MQILNRISLLALFILAVAQPEVKADSADTMNFKDKLKELDYVLERRNTYYISHELYIDSLKKEFKYLPKGDLQLQFALNQKIFDAYRSFQNDSARLYADNASRIARLSESPNLKALATYDELFTFMSKGDFTNAVEVLHKADLSGAQDSLRAEFYVLAARLYSDLSNFTSRKYEDKYAQKAYAYADTVTSIASEGSFAKLLASFYLHDNLQNREARIKTINSILQGPDINESTRGMLTSMLGDLYISLGQRDRGLAYKAESAILDIKASIRETTSKHFLAYELFEDGDVNRASKYIHSALEDAEYYNAPQRKAEIGRALSLIESSRYSSVSEERNVLWISLLAAVVFLIMSLVLTWYVRRQNRMLKESQNLINEKNHEISTQNAEISSANDKLRQLNSQLHESVKIKDGYIGYVFNLNSEYISKLEKIYKKVHLKITTHRAEDLRQLMPLSDIYEEKEKMLKEFDKIFLTLFPTFIDQYKSLFPKDKNENMEEPDGILTPEMRIFALIRLGVSNSADIAQFLNYSVNTINTYKTKAKKRSIVDNDEFESRIMQIRSVK